MMASQLITLNINMALINLSKSDYIKGLQCPKALWFSKNQRDLKLPLDEQTKSKFESGNEINDLARQYFLGGVKAADDYFDISKAVTSTKNLISQNHEIIFEATAQIENDGSHARIDILRKSDGKNGWDLIEVKGSTSQKPSHLNDLSFQYHVFVEAGYKINNTLVMLLNNDYVFDDKLDIGQLFKLEDITQEVIEGQEEVRLHKDNLQKSLKGKLEPKVKIGAKCFEKDGHHPECDFKHHCWKNVPEYSIFNVTTRKKTAETIIDEIDSYEVNDIDVSNYEKGIKELDIICYQTNKTHIDKEKLSEFVSDLKYPLYFLDYETFQLPIPIFQRARPYQQIPFQFSLHIQEKPNQELSHFEFLHQEKSDPRKDFIQSLINNCGDNGSIIVYHESFEKTINKQLARDFPEYSESLLNLNKRVIDLMVPFQKKYIYSPKQQSSNSIKKVLPAFTDLSYQNLEIKSGGDAMSIYADFIKGKINLDEDLIKNLLEYCKLDTYAMVKLLQKIVKFSQK